MDCPSCGYTIKGRNPGEWSTGKSKYEMRELEWRMEGVAFPRVCPKCKKKMIWEDPWEPFNQIVAKSAKKENEEFKTKHSSKEIFEMAISSILTNKLDDAIKYLKLLSKKNPYYFLAWVNMGVLYTYYNLLGMIEGMGVAYYRRYFNKGIKCFEKSLELRPKDITSIIGLADAYRGLKQYAKSLELFKIIRERKPNDFEDLSGIGFTFLNADRFKYQMAKYEIDEYVPINREYRILSRLDSDIKKESEEKYNKALQSMMKTLKYQNSQKIPKKYLINQEIWNIKLKDIASIIKNIESSKKKTEWKELEEYKSINENKIIEFIKPHKEIAVQAIAAHFLLKSNISDPEKYYEAARETVEQKLKDLIERNKIQGSVEPLPGKSGLYYINEEKINEIKEELVLNILLEFSEQFRRISLHELVEKVNNQVFSRYGKSATFLPEKVKEITINYINKGLIPAEYDDSSEGINFLLVEKKIDGLFAIFDDWENDDQKKKV